MIAELVRQYIASSREARRQARNGEANGHAPRVITGAGAST
jgi:hypothetical protein